jgi:hypothetical protein
MGRDTVQTCWRIPKLRRNMLCISSGHTSTQKMEKIWSTEKSLSAYKSAWCHYPEDPNLNSFFFSLALQPQFGPRLTSMKLSVSFRFSRS